MCNNNGPGSWAVHSLCSGRDRLAGRTNLVIKVGPQAAACAVPHANRDTGTCPDTAFGPHPVSSVMHVPRETGVCIGPRLVLGHAQHVLPGGNTNARAQQNPKCVCCLLMRTHTSSRLYRQSTHMAGGSGLPVKPASYPIAPCHWPLSVLAWASQESPRPPPARPHLQRSSMIWKKGHVRSHHAHHPSTSTQPALATAIYPRPMGRSHPNARPGAACQKGAAVARPDQTKCSSAVPATVFPRAWLAGNVASPVCTPQGRQASSGSARPRHGPARHLSCPH